MRMTRYDWGEANVRTKRPMTRPQRIAAFTREVRRRLKKDGLIQDKEPAQWVWDDGEEQGTVFAHTRSQAKGAVKKITKKPFTIEAV